MPRDPAGQLVEKEFLTLPVWDRFDAGMAESVARTVERCLPEPWRFARVERHECGDQARWVAFFTWKRKAFALIPGGEAELGWRPPPGFRPAAGMLEEWADTAKEYDLPPLTEFLAAHTTQPRTVPIQPLLVEVAAREGVGHTSDSTGEAELARDGFRIPTADEWEYLCAAGSRTLWRWGNECPVDGYPYDYQPRPRHHTRSHPGFDPHRKPNAFGLVFPSDGYAAEAVRRADGTVVGRSGDGGCLTCGGAGFVIGWLLLASSAVVETMSAGDDFSVVRRVYPFPPAMLD